MKKSDASDIKYKTQLCEKFTSDGSCPYGKRCRFAHGQVELREDTDVSREPYFRTRACCKFESTGTCAYGVRCAFIHPFAPGDTRLPVFKSIVSATVLCTTC